MVKNNQYPKQYNLCGCGNYKTKKSRLCMKCSITKRRKCKTLKDCLHSGLHGQSAQFNIIRGRARSQYKHIKECENCGYDKHVEVCHIKPISDFNEDALITDINNRSNIKILCPNCHWEFDNKNKKPKIPRVPKPRPRKVEWPTKETLQKLLWEKPTVQIAKDYNVTDNAVAKWAKHYNLDKPPRGYWMKVGPEGIDPSSRD